MDLPIQKGNLVLTPNSREMKIGYVILGDPGPSILKKAQSQLRHLNEIGSSAKLYVYSLASNSAVHSGLENTYYFHLPTSAPHPYLRAILFRRSIYRHLLQQTRKDKLDILYVRGNPSDSFIFHFINECPAKIVFELNSIQFFERLLQRRLLVGYYEEFCTRKSLRIADGFVGVSSSVRDYYAEKINNSVPSIVIGNGFEVDSVPMRQPPHYDGKNVKIIVVANYAAWHGLDRVILGLAAYNGPLRFSLTVIGNGAILNTIRQQVSDTDLEGQVSFLGEIYGDELNELFNLHHLALGPLAIHRKMLENASALKIREYLSRGIPFLLSGMDDDLASQAAGDFYLSVLANDTPIDFSILEQFASNAFNDPTLPQRMREYAEQHISMSIKTLKLVDFLGQLK